MDDKERLIAREVALKAAVEMAAAGYPQDDTVLATAERYETWLLRPQGGVETTARPVPQPQQGIPPDDMPYGEEPPPQGRPSSGPPAAHLCGHGPNDTQGCGTEMEHFSGRNLEGVDYAGYRCPEQKKTVDPAEQAAEKVRHPVQWINQ